MGCWNGTCGVSNLPIHHGDKVMALIIKVPLPKKIDNQSGACYANEFAAPVTLAFEGVYNDYGMVEKIKTNLITDSIIKDFGVTDLYKLLKNIERDEQYSSDPYSKNAAYGLWMCHKHVWDVLTRDPELKSGWEKTHPYHYYLDAFKEWYELTKKYEPVEKAYFLDLKDRVKNKEENIDETMKREVVRHYFDLKNAIEQNSFNECTGAGHGSSRIDVGGIADVLQGMIESGKDSNDPEIMTVVNAMCELKAMHIAMENLRKIWFPQSGKGSQSNAYAWHKKLIDCSVAIMEDYGERVNEDGWDPDEDYDVYKDWR